MLHVVVKIVAGCIKSKSSVLQHRGVSTHLAKVSTEDNYRNTKYIQNMLVKDIHLYLFNNGK